MESRPIAASGAILTKRAIFVLLVVLAALAEYWWSSALLAERRATLNFGADAHLYTLIAKGEVLERTLRFHPLTVGMAVAWMKALGSLTVWITPQQLLKALFGLIGAIGVLASIFAFRTLLPKGYATLFGLVYAASFGVWYFASIEESKIVTATLSALYIAVYLHLRGEWSIKGAGVLSGVLFAACLNEVVSGFLVVIPAVDVLLRRGWDWRGAAWLLPHALTAPFALAILEFGVNGRLAPQSGDAEQASHLSMLFFYILKSDHGLASLYNFLLNWLCFNIAAPTPNAPYWLKPPYGGYFEPVAANYFTTPASAVAAILLSIVLIAGLWRRSERPLPADHGAILPALLAYSVVRGLFFFIFNPSEALLFSPAVTLAHLLIVGVLFTSSAFPAKQTTIAALVLALIAANSAFIIGKPSPPPPLAPPAKAKPVKPRS